MHAKVWISDKKDVYIGSANNDWKSLTQVYPTKKKQALLNLQYGVEKKNNSVNLCGTTFTCIAGQGAWDLFCWLPTDSKNCGSLFSKPVDAFNPQLNFLHQTSLGYAVASF